MSWSLLLSAHEPVIVQLSAKRVSAGQARHALPQEHDHLAVTAERIKLGTGFHAPPCPCSRPGLDRHQPPSSTMAAVGLWFCYSPDDHLLCLCLRGRRRRRRRNLQRSRACLTRRCDKWRPRQTTRVINQSAEQPTRLRGESNRPKVGTAARKQRRRGYGDRRRRRATRRPLPPHRKRCRSRDGRAGLRPRLTLYDRSSFYGHGLSKHRFGTVLDRKPRDGFVLATKVGRCLVPPVDRPLDRSPYLGGLEFIDRAKHGQAWTVPFRMIDHSRCGFLDARKSASMSRDVRGDDGGSLSVLRDLRALGIIKPIGVGLNEVDACMEFAKAGDFDHLLLPVAIPSSSRRRSTGEGQWRLRKGDWRAIDLMAGREIIVLDIGERGEISR